MKSSEHRAVGEAATWVALDESRRLGAAGVTSPGRAQQQAQRKTYVIVGASLAGAKAAQTLREEGFTGRLVPIGDEAERPYERPPLSKGYLMGTDDKVKLYVHDEAWYREVIVIEPQPTPLQAALGPGARASVIGGFFTQVHRQHGVDVQLGTAVTGFRGPGTSRR